MFVRGVPAKISETALLKLDDPFKSFVSSHGDYNSTPAKLDLRAKALCYSAVSREFLIEDFLLCLRRLEEFYRFRSHAARTMVELATQQATDPLEAAVIEEMRDVMSEREATQRVKSMKDAGPEVVKLNTEIAKSAEAIFLMLTRTQEMLREMGDVASADP